MTLRSAVEVAFPNPAAPALSLPEVVYRQLREAILNGLYRPAQVLRQEELAARLGVSRAPLREALPRLEADGLVVSSPRRGYSVRSLEPEEIAEIFDLRILVESRAAYFATLHRTKEDVVRLKCLIEGMAAVNISDQAGIVAWADLNFKFHDCLFAPSRRRHFLRMVESLRAAVEPYIRVELAFTGQFEEAQVEHRSIAKAFSAGDADRVATLTKEHCEHTAARLMAGLSTRARESGRGSGIEKKAVPVHSFNTSQRSIRK